MLHIHFLNVGKGNCVIARFPSDRLTVVDIDNSRISDETESLQDPIEFLNSNYPGQSVFRFILTHPDMDHMSGLHELSQTRQIVNFWDTDHDKVFDLDSMGAGGYDKEDARAYQRLRASAQSPKVLRLRHDTDAQMYWNEDRIKVLSPSPNMIRLAKETGEYNHLSYVLMLEHEGIRILLGGDATRDAWKQIFRNHGANSLKADVFLAPHHGSPDNIEKDVFAHIAPDYVVVSDHRGHSYDRAYYNSLANKQVYSTKHFGNIELRISKSEKRIIPERNGS